MLPDTHLPFHGELFTDSPFPPNPWIELYQLAERAGVSVEHLCAAVEIAALHQKLAPPVHSLSPEETDLDIVVRVLAEGSVAVKQWEEDLHPRDDKGRFTNGSYSAHLEVRSSHITFYDPRQHGYRLPSPPSMQVQKQALQEATNIHNELLSRFPHSKSRWSRIVGFRLGFTMDGALAVKDWSCSITIAQELTDYINNPSHENHDSYEIMRLTTLLHESFHAIAPSNEEEYANAQGWEEATIENAVRIHQKDVLEKLGFSFKPHLYKARNEAIGYAAQVEALDTIRRMLQVNEGQKQAFYDHLITLRANEKESYIRSCWATLPEGFRQKHEDTFNSKCQILSSYKRAQGSPTPLKSDSRTMTREEVNELIFSAHTVEEVTHARQAYKEWMDSHPEDVGMRMSGEVLFMLASALGMEDPYAHTTIYIGGDE